MIPVTKPFLPPLHEYHEFLEGIWQRQWLTNNGPLVNDLELKLKAYLRLPHILFLGNGTIALQIAIKALDLRGEIITTPFSYIATASSIVWEHCRPVFVDIDPLSFNIDPSKIESQITERTSAILATHVYGNPCDIDSIARIATKQNLKVIYDAAHCFGTTFRGKSVFEFGDVSTTSFHATKVFHTIEGGAVFTNDPQLLKRMAFMRNFGHAGPESFAEVGINGKNSELHAAMGLVNLKYVDEILAKRKKQSLRYSKNLQSLNFPKLKISNEVGYNYAYYPLLFEDEMQTLRVKADLEGNLIFPRRYFYPGLNSLDILNKTELPITDSVTKRVLCLPLYHTLSDEEIDFVCRIIIRALNYR